MTGGDVILPANRLRELPGWGRTRQLTPNTTANRLRELPGRGRTRQLTQPVRRGL